MSLVEFLGEVGSLRKEAKVKEGSFVCRSLAGRVVCTGVALRPCAA